MRPWEQECGFIRTWHQVAAEYRRRYGGPMSKSYAQAIAARALRKIRRHLADNPRALEA